MQGSADTRAAAWPDRGARQGDNAILIEPKSEHVAATLPRRGAALGGGEGAVGQFHVELCRRCKPRDAEIRNEASGDEAQLAEVVENLMRANLNPAEGGQM